jgi:hypothetical protein
MIAAIQMQWLGVGVAALIVAALLIVVLIRHRGEDERLMSSTPDKPTDLGAGPPPGWTGLAAPTPAPPAAVGAPAPPAPTPPAAAPPAAAPLASAAPAPRPPLAAVPPASAGSFLDEPLSRDFDGLGKRTGSETAAPPAGPFPVDPFGSHDDIFPPAAGAPPAEAPGAQEPAVEAAAADMAAPEELAVEAPAAEAQAPAPPAAEASAAEDPVAAAPAAEAAPAAPPVESAPAASPAEAAPLSDVIVTSGDGQVDLADPDVRALLVSLVDDEIALAKAYRSQGQTLDAILQLTEAEKACTALGLDDTLADVKALLGELQL